MKQHFKLLILPLTVSICSCTNHPGIYTGQSTNRAYEHLLNLNIPYIRKRDYTLFQYENKNYVMQLNYDYQNIKKVKNFDPILPTLSDFDRLESGMDLFQIVKQYGIPCLYGSNSQDISFGFQTKEKVVKMVFFHTDTAHIYKTY